MLRERKREVESPMCMHSNWNLLKYVKFYDYDYSHCENEAWWCGWGIEQVGSHKRYGLLISSVPFHAIQELKTTRLSLIKSTSGYQIFVLCAFKIFVIYLDSFNISAIAFFFITFHLGFVRIKICPHHLHIQSANPSSRRSFSITIAWHWHCYELYWIIFTLYFITS